ncbi:hypothetical protein H6G89_23945 [Oscillatoria sp. FACHB-1407]|uniref:hypothetical protein n=1 Tax=Oscillatoria sp. FACHB-1407 TaxID=2692847 RepID=UPI001686F27A|nr:hypothetical protein [Oscillatoria sp. FACHB-1407]MBD2464060.1 hypothetical protein [Oscillatoria sp. FACHB-1407]
MNCTKGLVGYSILWIGLLLSVSENAVANPAIPLKVESPDATASQPSPDRPSTAPVAMAIAPIKIPSMPLEQQGLSASSLQTTATPKELPAAPYPETPALPSGYPATLPLEDETPSNPTSEPDASTDDLTETGDPELGILRLRERELTIEQTNEPNETVFLLGGVNYLRSDNILLDDFDPVNDQLLSAGATLLAVPSLGPQTQMIAAINGNLTRYSRLPELDYNNFGVQIGVQQQLLPNTYGEISLSNQQFIDANSGDRFLNDYSAWFVLSRRDRLNSNLTLDSFYQLRLRFTDPSDRSRVGNTLGVSLNYDLPPDFSVELDYQIALTDFTRQDRNDVYHQLTTELNYYLSSNTRASVFGGFSFGDSSDPDINFNSFIFGASINFNLSLF